MPAADPFLLPVWRLENSGEATAKRGEVAVLEMQALRLRRSEGLGVITHDGSMVLLYMVCHGSINIPQMLAYIPSGKLT